MSLTSMPKGKVYPKENLQIALLYTEAFIEHKRWDQGLENYPFSKHEGDNVCEDIESEDTEKG